MVGAVFVIVFAWGNWPKLSERIIGVQKPDFTRRMACRSKQEQAPAACTFDFDAKALVGLFVKQCVRPLQTNNMPVEPVGALRNLVLNSVEKRFIVRGPSDAGDTLDVFFPRLTGLQLVQFK